MAPFFILTCQTEAEDDTVLRVAVATNFERALSKLEPAFEAQSGYDVQVSYGSSGKLYAQIRAGAPFDVFLSADQNRAAGFLNDGAPRPAFTYAYGQLALWAKDDRLQTNPEAVLNTQDFRKIALANPDLAPYGQAAVQVLEALDLKEALADKIVLGENVGQAYALIATGNAELGFVAASYRDKAKTIDESKGSFWVIPPSLYDPIAQDAVQITNIKAAKAFADFLQSEPAKVIIRQSGYATP